MGIIKNINNDLLDESELQVTLHGMKSALINDILNKIKELSHTHENVIISGEPGTGKRWIAKFMYILEQNPKSGFYYLSCEQLKSSEVGQISDEIIQEHKKYLPNKYKYNNKKDQFYELTSEVQLRMLEAILEIQKFCANRISSKEDCIRFIFTMNGDYLKSNTKEYVWTYLIELLNPISVVIPPLREHREDIFPLAKLFLEQQKKEGYRESEPQRDLQISHQALHKCISYSWPGNIRQLKNAMIHAYFSCKDDIILPKDLPSSIDSFPIYYSTTSDKNKSWSFIKAERKLLKRSSILQKDKISEASIRSMLKKIIKISR